ncbi:alanine/ornithine racemase family PLP-dependent enzyme, partial [Xanthomonas citri pv. citri]|nr:alanine/ornithine racemase family PLP-dependent enzyme [Xanthomonas citri pv. citri]
MNRSTPRLEIFADRIRDNARAIVTQCAKHGVQVAAVTKVLHAHPVLLQALEDTGVTMLADSRLQNLRQIAECGTSLPTMLLRAPGRHDIDDTVQLADISLNSSLTTMTALSEAAVRAGTH